MVPTQVTREESDRDREIEVRQFDGANPGQERRERAEREREVQQLDGANAGHVFKLVTPDTGTWACRCVSVI
jgi:hypothetical protein